MSAAMGRAYGTVRVRAVGGKQPDSRLQMMAAHNRSRMLRTDDADWRSAMRPRYFACSGKPIQKLLDASADEAASTGAA
jgi:hypothetical protein